MAKITIAGEAVVITSAVKLEDLKTIAKYRPEALTLMGGEDNKEPIFAISVTRGAGEINKYGASFGAETHDEAKLATITMGIGYAGDDSIEEFVADAFGAAFNRLEELEATLPAVIEAIAADKAAVMSSITVAQ